MKKKIILLLCILISFIIQKGIVFAETANVSTEEQPTNNSYNVSEFPTMLSYGQLKSVEAIDPYYIPVYGYFDFNAPVIRALDVFDNEIPIQLLDKRWNVGVALDPSRPGNSAAAYYNYKNGRPRIVQVKVAYKTSIETKDSILDAGQEWNPKDNFVKATDENGKDIPFGYRIIKSQDYLDTSIPGVYEITYSYKSQLETVESSFFVTVKDKSSIETKNSTLYVGQKWDPKDNFVNATDEEGKSIPWEDPRITKNGASIDTSKPGEHKIKYTFQGKVKNVDSEFTVTVKEDKTSLELNSGNHYIYQGEQWDPKRGLKKATDADGNILSIDKVEHWWGGDKPIDPNKVGDTSLYYYRVYRKDGTNIYNNIFVQVKEDKSNIKTKNSILYVGQKWDPKDNFVNATDEDGKSIPWEDPRITQNGASIDTSKPGEHKIKYTFQGKVKNVDSEFTVTVKEDKSNIKTKNSILYVGQKWDPKDNFVNATDEDGKSIPWEDPRITKNGASIDTSKPGEHKIKYTFQGKVKNVDSEFTVTVKEDKTSLELNSGDHYIYQGEQWDPKRGLKKATDADGNILSIDKVEHWWGGDKPIDPNKVGDTSVYFYRVYRKDGTNIYNSIVVQVKEDKTSLELNSGNHYIYQGEQWDPKRGLKKATDADGNILSIDKVEHWWGGDKPIDPNKVGDTSLYYYRVYRKDGTNIYNNIFVQVKEDKSNIKTKNSILYVGQKWDPKDNFVNATDEDGKSIPWEDPRITQNGASIDTSKPGEHKIKYTFQGKVKNVDSEFTVTVKEDKSNIKTKNSILYVGQKWDPKDNFVNATDEDGKSIPWEDPRITKNGVSIDTSKPGEHKIKYTFQGKVKNVDSEFTVTVKEDKSNIKTKNSILYVGQKWDPKDNFVNATDEDGKSIPWEDPRITKNGASIDTSKPGEHKIKYTFQGKVKNVDSEFTVTVKEDKTSLELNSGDHYIYQGEQWDPKRGLKKATDADGNILSIDKVEHWWGGDKPIDPNKVGDTSVYYYRVYRKDGTNIYNYIVVQVKEDKSNIKTKNSILYVGQKWDPKDNFVNATDEDGKSIPWEDSRITKNGASIDTSKPGEHKIKYTFQGKVKNVDSEFTVTVKEEPFTIKQVPYFDFEDHILVPTNKSVVNKKENPTIELETPSIAGKDWQLQVELSPFLDKENGKSILKGVSLFIPKGKLESDLETEEPTQYDCQLEANGKASILMQGMKTKGKGRWKNKLETKGITLSIPSENKTGNYESILHWTLLDVPG